jgi:DNA-binding NarL/FixJ family response regulator
MMWGPNLEPLTPRQTEILALVAEGLTDDQIAKRLYIARGTVKAHLGEVYTRLGVENRTQAAITYVLGSARLPAAGHRDGLGTGGGAFWRGG